MTVAAAAVSLGLKFHVGSANARAVSALVEMPQTAAVPWLVDPSTLHLVVKFRCFCKMFVSAGERSGKWNQGSLETSY